MEYQDRIKLLKELCEAKGISGHERNVTRIMKKHLQDYADEFIYDNLGSLIAKKAGSGDVKVMLAGHVDEIGFLVSKIEKDGFLRLHPIGGWWGHVLMSQRLVVTTKEGKEIMGVIGAAAPHGMGPEDRKKVKDVKELFVDLGVKDDEAVRKLGIRVGDPVTPVSTFEVMNDPNYVVCKAFDDRVGAAIAMEVMMNLKNEDHPNVLYSCGTVQEEVGLRGARTAGYLVDPDIAIAIDVTLADDFPGGKSNCKLGLGTAISIADGSVIGHHGLIRLLEDICIEKNIPYTFDMLSAGGTDSGEIHKTRDGVVTSTISIPSRYCHSHNTIIHMGDYDASVRLLTEFVKRLDRKTLDELKKAKQ